MSDAAAVLGALGDGSRRAIFEAVATGERSVTDICAEVGLRQPTVSQHLRALREVGLVVVRPDGNRRLYRVDLDGLAPLRAYLDGFWDRGLAAFAAYADDPTTDPNRPPLRTHPEDATP